MSKYSQTLCSAFENRRNFPTVEKVLVDVLTYIVYEPIPVMEETYYHQQEIKRETVINWVVKYELIETHEAAYSNSIITYGTFRNQH